MKTSIDIDSLAKYTANQLNCAFPDGNLVEPRVIAECLPLTLSRVERCFSAINRKYFFERGEVQFDHLHGDHYAMYLYLLSNALFKAGAEKSLPTKLFLLNKALHGIDAYFSIELPAVFLFVHPIGTILGNAKYRDYFVVYQNCSVGADEDGAYPTFGEGVILYSNARVIGKCNVGHNVVFAANAFVLNVDIPSDSVVTGSYPGFRVADNSRHVRERVFE